MEDFIVDTVLGTFIVEGYDYHIQKGLSEVKIQNLFKEITDLED